MRSKILFRAPTKVSEKNQGFSKPIPEIKGNYYNPNLNNSIQTYFNDCEIYQQFKSDRNPV